MLIPDPWTIWRLWGQRHWLLWQIQMRHARMRMEARMARYFYSGKLKEAHYKDGKLRVR